MIEVAKLQAAREAAGLIDDAVVAVQDLAAREEGAFPMRERIRELRRIARALATLEGDLDRVYQ